MTTSWWKCDLFRVAGRENQNETVWTGREEHPGRSRENSELGGEGASVLGQDFQAAWPEGHHTLQRACTDSPKHEAGAGWGELPPTPPLSPMFRTVKENSSILPKATPLTSATAR